MELKRELDGDLTFGNGMITLKEEFMFGTEIIGDKESEGSGCTKRKERKNQRKQETHNHLIIRRHLIIGK